MLSKLADLFFKLIIRARIPVLSRVHFIPVLHVERLHDDSSYNSTLDFAIRYFRATGCKAVMTVITPVAPILQEELKRIGFDESIYRERIIALSQVADIGLHGHFCRQIRDGIPQPVHNYWFDLNLVSKQISSECNWLESNGLMKIRAYSAGWWHLNSDLLSTLESMRFRFDFSHSKSRFNDSPSSSNCLHRNNPGVFKPLEDGQIHAVWAVSSLGDSVDYSFVPKRVISSFPFIILRKKMSFLSLYSHDWDLNVDAALNSIQTISALGGSFVSLESLPR